MTVLIPEPVLPRLAHEGHGGGDEAAAALHVVRAVLDGGLKAVLRLHEVVNVVAVILQGHLKSCTSVQGGLSGCVTQFVGIRLEALPHCRLLIPKRNSYFKVDKSLSSTKWLPCTVVVFD